jgi:hypothetical protein
MKRDIVTHSPQPEWFTAGAMVDIRDAYEAAALGLPHYREAAGDLRADDLRSIDKEYCDSLKESIESAFKHLQTVMGSHNYDQDWMELLTAVYGAAEVIAKEVLELAAKVAEQEASLSPIKEAASLDPTSLHDIHNKAPAEKL